MNVGTLHRLCQVVATLLCGFISISVVSIVGICPVGLGYYRAKQQCVFMVAVLQSVTTWFVRSGQMKQPPPVIFIPHASDTR